MQRNDMSEIKKILVDGEELPGLTSIAEVPLARGEVEAPEQAKVRRIQNGVTTIPSIEVTYKISRNTQTYGFLKSWFDNNEVHDITVIRADAHGVEYDRDLWPNCELGGLTKPAYDAANPVYAQVSVTIIPWDIIGVEAG